MPDQNSLYTTDVPDRYRNQKVFHQLQLAIFAVFAIFIVPACASNNQGSDLNIDSSPIEKHVVKHAFGEVQVPVNPKRVVLLNIAPLDTAITLGIKPIGGVSRLSDSIPPYLADRTEEMTIVGRRPQPNLEKIMLLKPDLILGNARDYQHVYNKLSQIAPTVMIDSDNWKERFLLYSKSLGRQQKAEKLLSEYNSRIEKLREELGDQKLANTEISVITVVGNQVYVLIENSLPGEILDEIGLAVPPIAQNKNDNTIAPVRPISRESLESIDSDVIFLVNLKQSPENNLTLQTLTSDPFFSRLKAVKQGRLYPVDGESWSIGNSIQAANIILDDLFKYLVEEQ